MNFIIVGLEHQNLIHYGMPVRIMLEDAAGYDEQLRTLQRQNRRLKKLSSKEFLGGIRKEDRLKAVLPSFCIMVQNHGGGRFVI